MSKFLKFIVHFIVICTIICVVGLAVPPFLGITTEILDDSSKETNLPMGSVTYAIPVKTEEAAVGDSILYQGDSKAYKYMITEIDQKNKTFQVHLIILLCKRWHLLLRKVPCYATKDGIF